MQSRLEELQGRIGNERQAFKDREAALAKAEVTITSLQEQLRAERSAQEMTLETQDCVEGVRAFFEKREPHFSDH